MSEIKVTFVQPDGSKRIIDVEEGNTLMEAAKYVAEPYVEGIEAICGGQCICATCHVWVDKKWIDEVGLPEDNSQEQAWLDYEKTARLTSRLSCQVKLTKRLDGLVVHIPEDKNERIKPRAIDGFGD